MKSILGRAGVTSAALGFAVLAAGCGAANQPVSALERPTPGAMTMSYPGASYQTTAPGATFQNGPSPAGPVLVTCQPDQRALVRQVMHNGQAASQVECVSNVAPGSYSDPRMVQYAPAYAPAAYAPGYAPLPAAGDVRVVPAVTYREPARRVVTERRVVSARAQETRRPSRSVKKSAIIIGSSAGVGAGVGAAVGGKKGALIGAAIGGGSAAIWDQMTRNNDR
jgi:hypothetical protein